MNIVILAPGACPHRPISNGWSESRTASLRQPPYTWCGRCKAYIEHDAEWRAKFAAAGRPVVPLPQTSLGRTPAA